MSAAEPKRVLPVASVVSRFMGMRRSAILETTLFLFLAVLWDVFLGEGDRFWTINPHPFWAIIVLVSAQYGTREGVFAALCSSLVLTIGNMPTQSLSQDAFLYTMMVLKLPLLWFVTAVVLGELRVRQLRERHALLKRLHDVERREETFTRSYDQLKEIKEYLEIKLAGHLRSAVNVYQAIRHIEKFDPMEVLLGVDEIVNSMMAPDKLSVYALGPNGFEAASSMGWKKEDHYARRFTQESPLFREVAGRHRVLCILNEADEAILDGEGLLAGPLIDVESGDIFGMLKIEDMSFLDLTVTNVEIFKILCEWIGMAYAQAVTFQKAQSNAITNATSGCLSAGFYEFMLPRLQGLVAAEEGKSLSVYTISIEGISTLKGYKQQAVYLALHSIISAEIGTKGFLCEGEDGDASWRLIMLGQNESEFAALQRRVNTRLAKEQGQDETLLSIQLNWKSEKYAEAA